MTITMMHLRSFCSFFFAFILPSLFFSVALHFQCCHELGGPFEFGRIDFLGKAAVLYCAKSENSKQVPRYIGVYYLY
jgi:hypothetical protein